MTKALAAMLLASLMVVACGDQTAPLTSPPGSFGASSPGASASSPGATGSTKPGTSPSLGTSLAPTVPPPPTPTPSPPVTATPAPTPPPPISEFPQSWSGTWQDPVTGGSGSLELTLNGKGSDFGGSITMDGTACLSTGLLDGAYDGRDIEFTVTQRAVEVRFAGEADAATMTGTFTTDCDSMDGTWTTTRASR